jgi:hypothetical protein
VTTTGAVTLNCGLDGAKLVDCHVVRESPAGRGLGPEGVAIAATLTADAKAVAEAKNGRVEFTFKLPLPDPST